MQSFHSAHFSYYELTPTSEERGSFFIPFFLCFYTFIKVRAIKLYSLHMISWLEAQERNRLTRQNVIPKAECWGEREENKYSGAISSDEIQCWETLRNVCETWWILFLLFAFHDQAFAQPRVTSSTLQHSWCLLCNAQTEDCGNLQSKVTEWLMTNMDFCHLSAVVRSMVHLPSPWKPWGDLFNLIFGC